MTVSIIIRIICSVKLKLVALEFACLTSESVVGKDVLDSRFRYTVLYIGAYEKITISLLLINRAERIVFDFGYNGKFVYVPAVYL